MQKRLKSILPIVPFLVLIFIIGLGTVYKALPEIDALAEQMRSGEVDYDITQGEALLKDELVAKNGFVELAGATQRFMGRHLSADGQFYQAHDGLIHLRREEAPYDDLIDSIGFLSKTLSDRGIPFLVCQTAERAAYGDSYSELIDGTSLEYLEPLKATLAGTDTLYLDYVGVFEKDHLTSDQIFFKTDLHYTTDAEFSILQNIVDRLEADAGLHFENKATVLDLANYNVEDYPFLGNLAYSYGQFYAGTDTFRYYIPDFDTTMHLDNPSQSVEREGSFESVCMNGYRDSDDSSARIYRITDYLQFMTPCYTITNHLVDDNDILVIGCSMSMRTTAYLTLLCHSVTVLDPRFFNEYDYLADALQSEYDAVICFPSFNLINGVGGYGASIRSWEIDPNENGSFDLSVEMENTGIMSWKSGGDIRMQILVDGSDVDLRADVAEGDTVKSGNSYIFVFRDLDSAFMQRELSGQMQREGWFYFGERMDIEWTGQLEGGVLDAEIVSHTAPSIVNHTESYSFDITVKNTGASAWSEPDAVRLCIWQDGTDWGYRLRLPEDVTVMPDEEYTFTLDNFVLPEAESTTLGFQMLKEGIEYFGERAEVYIRAQ